jgi:hypothetical protein
LSPNRAHGKERECLNRQAIRSKLGARRSRPCIRGIVPPISVPAIVSRIPPQIQICHRIRVEPLFKQRVSEVVFGGSVDNHLENREVILLLASVHHLKERGGHVPLAIRHPSPSPKLYPTARSTGHGDARKSIHHQQVQQVLRISGVRLLPPHGASPNLGRIAQPQLVPEFGHHAPEPLRVTAGLDADQRRLRQVGVKRSGLSVLMFQPARHDLARFLLQHRNHLVARMQITSDNRHVGLLSRQPRLGQPKSTGTEEPTPLWNQSLERHETLRYPSGTKSRRLAKNAGLRHPRIETQHHLTPSGNPEVHVAG